MTKKAAASHESGPRRMLRRHVALAWVLFSVVAIFIFAFAINLTRF
jgi:hypothetical protein